VTFCILNWQTMQRWREHSAKYTYLSTLIYFAGCRKSQPAGGMHILYYISWYYGQTLGLFHVKILDFNSSEHILA
jgi:hypothetical protein